MKAFGVLLLVCTLGNAVEVTPVQKVIQLLDGMAAKGVDEMKKEQVQFAAYKTFCENTADAKNKEIAELGESIERLTAQIEELEADIASLDDSIEHDENDVTRWEGNLKAERNVRQIQKADYDKLYADYSESIDALQRALAVLKEKQVKTAQAAALVQVSAAPLVPEDAKNTIATILAQAGEEPTAPEANAYEFQSGGVVAMLEKLTDKFIAERTALEKAESTKVNAFELVEQDLEKNIANSKAKIEDEKVQRATAAQKKADSEGNKQEDIEQKASTEEYLNTLVSTCETKATDFQSRQKLRSEELEAIAKATEILSSDDVSGAADKHLPAASLIQAGSNTRSPTQRRAASYLQSQAKQLNSRVLAAVATHVADDPFAKVKKMIKDLIVQLMEEANEEAEHKGFCDTELSTNEQTRLEKTSNLEKLHASIEELAANVVKLGEEIAALEQTIAETTTNLAEATAKREEEKATNKQTIEDAIGAQEAVKKALGVLREFYDKAAKATALVQAPEIFDKPYTGLGGESGGVVGMLEVILSDFERLQSDTETEEAENADAHRTFTSESEILIAESKKSLELKTKNKQDKEQAHAQAIKDMEGNQAELDAALDYYEKLKPSCVSTGVSFEDRVEKRKAEIQSLQEALQILQSFDENN